MEICLFNYVFFTFVEGKFEFLESLFPTDVSKLKNLLFLMKYQEDIPLSLLHFPLYI